jgi:hypothetical protein
MSTSLSSSGPLSFKSFSDHRNHQKLALRRQEENDGEDRQEEKDVQGRAQAQRKIQYYWQGGVRLRRPKTETAEVMPWTNSEKKSTTAGLTPFQLAMLRSLRQKETAESPSQPQSSRLASSRNEPLVMDSGLQYPNNNGTQHEKHEAEVILQRAIGLLQGMRLRPTGLCL